jgi:hypothetical protein
MSVTQSSSSGTLVLPTEDTLNKAFKLSLKFTKPIDTYFYLDSCKGNVCILNDGEEMVIFKNEDEHTSPILKIFKSGDGAQYITMTENTIYILSANTQIRNINDEESSA